MIAEKEAQSRLERLLSTGMSPKLAEMLAYQSPPGARGTERAFMEGRFGADGQWADEIPFVRDAFLEAARQAGINTHGKVYVSGLADEGLGPADPTAWVSDSHELKAVAEAKGLTVEGAVNYVSSRPQKKPEPVPLCEELVQESIAEILAENPAKALKSEAELRAEAIEKHGTPVNEIKRILGEE